MKNNIYVKSMLRQPVRTFLLFLLIALAAYTFVLRAVEYASVSQHIDAIAANYRAIGFLPAETDFTDVSAAANILRDSPQVGREDRRRMLEGIAHDFFVPDVMGMNRGVAMENQWRFTGTLFYGEVDEVWFDANTLNEGVIWIRVVVDDVMAGMPHHVVERQQVWIRYEFPPAYPRIEMGDDEAIQAYGAEMFAAIGGAPVVGQRYFFYAHYYFHMRPPVPPDGPTPSLPAVGRTQWDWLIMQPIDAEANTWFVPVSEGETLDFDALGLSHIAELGRLFNHSQRAFTLRSSTDMTAMPELQGMGASLRLNDGRWINLEDNLENNHVVVIGGAFAFWNNLRIGDTMTFNIHTNQFVDGMVPTTAGQARPANVIVRSDHESDYYTIELEIVGIFTDSVEWGRTFGFATVFVPDSIIPDYITVGAPRRDVPGFNVEWVEGHLPSAWYSFTLASTRFEQSFLIEYRQTLHPQRIGMFQSGAGGFWSAVDPILLVILLNAAIFTAVLVMVLILVAFLYLRQRRRDFAIMRALGIPIRKILVKLCVSVFLFGLPAAAIGGGLAWNFAISEAQATLQPFVEMALEETDNVLDVFAQRGANAAAFRAEHEGASVPLSLLFILIGATLALLLIIIIIGYIIPLRRSVLEQLQGGSKRKVPKAKKGQVLPPDPTPEEIMDALGKLPDLAAVPYNKPRRNRLLNSFNFISSHIARSMVKTVLGFVIALFFIAALGMLQETVRSTEENIEYLYDTNIVRVEIGPQTGMGGLPLAMTRMGAHNFAENRFVEGYSAESHFITSFVIPLDENGVLPENWYEIAGIDPAQGRANTRAQATTLTLDNLQLFIDEHYVELVDDVGEGFVLTIHIDFAQDFTPDDFYFDADNPDRLFPVIISQSTAEERGLAPGDSAYFVFVPMGIQPNIRNFIFVPVFVAGIHNEYLFRPGLQNANIIPTAAYEHIAGWMTMYHFAVLTVDPDFNRQLVDARNEIIQIASSPSSFRWWPLDVLFMDEEIRMVVGAMGQILILLEVIYPIAIGLAVAIGAAMSMLLMLQMAKNAAIMRVLGTTKTRAITMLCAEQLIVCFVGLLIGLGGLIGLSLGFGPTELLQLAGLYFAGAIVGSIAGAIIIAGKAPLDLLQVRE